MELPFSLFLLLLTTKKVLTEEIELKPITGYFLEQENPPLFYDKVIPLWFRFPLPHWESTDVVMNETKCASAEWAKGSSCPVTYYLPEVQRRFANYILQSQPTRIISTFPLSQNNMDNADCHLLNEIGRASGKTVRLDETTLEEYIESVEKCSALSNTSFGKLKRITDYTYGIQDVFLNMSLGFRKEVWAKLPADRIDAGMLSNAVSAFNALLFANYQIEINRWKFALEDCQNGRIPSLVHSDDFRSLMDQLRVKLDRDENTYALTLPPDCSMNCYHSGHSHCILSEKEFVVSIAIPVVSKASTPVTLMKANTGNFAFNDKHTCEFSNGPIDTNFLVKQEEGIAYETSCESNKWCHTPSQLISKKINVCTSMILNKETGVDEFLKQCPLKCQEINGFLAETRIERMTRNLFLISGKHNSSDPEVVIKCNGDDEFFRPPFQGSSLIVVPCGCTIYHWTLGAHGITVFCPNHEVSTTEVLETTVIPVHWLSSSITKNLTIGDLITLEINQTDIFTGLEDAASPEKYADACLNQETSSYTAVIILLVFSCIFSLTLSLYLAYEFKKLSKQIGGQITVEKMSAIPCQEFNSYPPLLNANTVSNPHYEDHLYTDVL